MIECTCTHYVVDYSDPERYHPENVDREDDPGCVLHGGALASEIHDYWCRALDQGCEGPSCFSDCQTSASRIALVILGGAS